MRLHAVNPEDFPRWLDLREKLHAGLESAFHIEEMQLMHSSAEAAAFLCVTDDGEVAGLLEVSLRNFVDGCLGGPVGYIEGLYLEPGFRGAGLGRAIVDDAAEWFRRKGCRDMATDAELHNAPAQEFFAHIGFTETFRIVEFRRPLVPSMDGYSSDDHEDAT